jgi:predicted dehydrogenase
MEALRVAGGVEVTALADTAAPNLEHAASLEPQAKVFRDWRELLRQEDLDAVCVCTPNHLHCEQTVAALETGRHVLVEKPMAMSVHEAVRMEQAAKTAGKLLQVGFQQRFSPDARMFKRQAESGFFGDILFVRVQAMRRRGIPNWGVYGRKELQGGGPLIDYGIHNLEMAHYIMGSPVPLSASGACYRYFGDRKSSTVCRWPEWDHATYNVEDLAVGFVRFEGGATLAIETSFVAQIEKDVSRIQIMGTKGGSCSEPSLRVFDPAQEAALAPGVLYSDLNDYMVTMTPAHQHTETATHVKMLHFIDCIRNGTPCMAPARDGVLVQKMIEGIYRSAEAGKEVSLA